MSRQSSFDPSLPAGSLLYPASAASSLAVGGTELGDHAALSAPVVASDTSRRLSVNRRSEDEKNVAEVNELPTEVIPIEPFIDPSESLFKSIKNLWEVAWPMVLTQAIREATLVVGGVYLAHDHDPNDDAASALIFTLTNAYIHPLTGPLFVVNILASQAYGASLKAGAYSREERNQHLVRAGTIWQQGNLMSLILSTVPFALCFLTKPLLILFKQSQNIIEINDEYFKFLSIGILPTYLFTVSEQFADAVGQQRITATCNVLTLPLTLVLGYGLVNGAWGLPQMNAKGYALAYSIQAWVKALFLNAYLFAKKELKPFELTRLHGRSDRRDIFSLLWNIGKYISLQIGSELFALAGMSIMAGALGDNEATAQGMANLYMFLIIVPLLSMQNAAGALVGRYHGAKQNHLLKRYDHIATTIATVAPAALLVASLSIPKQLAVPFLKVDEIQNKPIIDMFGKIMPWYSAGLMGEAPRLVKIGSCRGVSDTKIPMFLAIITAWGLGILLQYVLGFPADLDITGIAVGRFIGLASGAILLSGWWNRKANMVARDGEESEPLIRHPQPADDPELPLRLSPGRS